MTNLKRIIFLLFILSNINFLQAADQKRSAEKDQSAVQTKRIKWKSTDPLVSAADRAEDPCYSVKDPSIVHFNGMNYLFMTIRSVKRTHQVEFLSFADWKDANKVPRVLLKMHSGYYCAPQVFYFSPHQKWYMICQAARPDWQMEYGGHYGPVFSTTVNIADPNSWTPFKPMEFKAPYYEIDHKKTLAADRKNKSKNLESSKPLDARSRSGEKANQSDSAPKKKARPGLDYWVICDQSKAHLFFTTNNGDLWREETAIDAFPYGWSEPKLALHDDIFEASHTYKIKGKNQYITIVEAINKKALDSMTDEIKGHRVYKAYISDRLDGQWHPVTASRDDLFAGVKNVQFDGPVWSENFSHGEILRAGYDEKMEIDPTDWKLLYQGVLDKDIHPGKYGEIPWRLGLLIQQ